MSKRVLFVTDGGKGVIKALKQRFGSGLIHQKCTIHKDRIIQRHLAKRWRKVKSGATRQIEAVLTKKTDN